MSRKNPTYAGTPPPLLERNPAVFRRSVSIVLLLLCVLILYLLVRQPACTTVAKRLSCARAGNSLTSWTDKWGPLNEPGLSLVGWSRHVGHVNSAPSDRVLRCAGCARTVEHGCLSAGDTGDGRGLRRQRRQGQPHLERLPDRKRVRPTIRRCVLGSNRPQAHLLHRFDGLHRYYTRAGARRHSRAGTRAALLSSHWRRFLDRHLHGVGTRHLSRR